MIDRFSQLRIAVLGDFFLDRYLLVAPEKDEPSLETGLTAYQVIGRRQSPGAAGTVARNLKTLGVGEVMVLGMTGLDGEGFELREELRKIKVDTQHLLVVPEIITPCYLKPMRLGREETEINRLDIKNHNPCPAWVVDYLLKTVGKLADTVDAVMVLDQVTEPETGVVTRVMRERLAKIGSEKHKAIFFADSRARITDFSNLIVKCNHYEAVGRFYPEYERIVGSNLEPPEELVLECAKRMEETTRRPLFITLGERGIYVVENGKLTHVPAFKVEGPIDICGAGDAVSSGIVASICAGASLSEAARIGNAVASITIRQLGSTGTATPELLRAVLGW